MKPRIQCWSNFCRLLLLVTAILTNVARAETWRASGGAQSPDKGLQALAFFPSEIWIHAGDSIIWTIETDEIHTVTFLAPGQVRPTFQTGCGSPLSDPATFDGSKCVSTPAFVKGQTFTVVFPVAGNFKLVCLVHPNMTGTVHVLDPLQPLPHDQDFYNQQAERERRQILRTAI